MKWCLLLLVLFSVSQGMAAGRTVLSFNDGWTFKKGPFTEDKVKFKEIFDREWDKVKIPHTWNARDMQQKYNQFYAGEAYYRKKFPVDAGLKEKRVFLRFEGVGQVMDLYLNGRYIGNHKGGYSACVFELSKALKYGQENELLVRVSNAASPEVIPVNHVRGIRRNIPAGVACNYGQVEYCRERLCFFRRVYYSERRFSAECPG